MPDFFSENLAPSVTQETDASLVALGQRGAIAVDGSGAVGNFAAIQCITDCVFDQLTTLSSADYSLFVTNSTTIPAGTIFYGPFTEIGATSGIYIAYKAG